MSWVRFEPRDEAATETTVMFDDGGTASVMGSPPDVLRMVEEADAAGLLSIPVQLAPDGPVAVFAVDQIERLS